MALGFRQSSLQLITGLLCLLITAGATAESQGRGVDELWRPMADVSLEIQPGSPLDFSNIFTGKSVDTPVVVDSDGQFTVSGQATRFLCAPMILTPPYGGFPDHATSDRYVQQLKRTGYNLVRIHHIESTLMTSRARDFDYDPEQLDRLHYLLAVLRKADIRWMIDVAASENGAYGNVQPHRWVNRYDLKARVHVAQDAQDHWRRMVTSLYGRINPYTAQSILADSALLGVVLFNEGGLQFLTHVGKKVPEALRPALIDWLRKRYPEGKGFGEVWSQPASALRDGNVSMPESRERSRRMDDVLVFYDSLQAQTANWMQEHLRSRGFRGLVTAYNNMPTVHMATSRARFDWVDMHSYHDESLGFARGARQRNDSSLDRGLKYLTQLASANMVGRAFTASEWGQPFWNAWRRESAIAGPGVASLQDWGAICQHASTAVDLSYDNAAAWKQRIMPYSVGLDPVGRAVETLAALLYRRGDVAKAKNEIRFVLPTQQNAGNANYWGVPDAVERLALITRVRSALPSELKENDGAVARIAIAAQGDMERVVSRVARGLGAPTMFGQETEDRFSEQLVGSKFRPSRGEYMSDTHQLYFGLNQRRIELRSPRTVGASFDRIAAPIDLGVLQIIASSDPAMVALSSLDGKPLDKADRALLFVVTDALNTGMRFAGADRQELVELGRLPARIAPAQIKMNLGGEQKFRLTPLRANGTSAAPGQIIEPGQTMTLDPANRNGGPGFYFYVERL